MSHDEQEDGQCHPHAVADLGHARPLGVAVVYANQTILADTHPAIKATGFAGFGFGLREYAVRDERRRDRLAGNGHEMLVPEKDADQGTCAGALRAHS